MAKKTNDEFLKEVHDAVGDEYTILSEYQGNNKPIKIKHNTCGREYITQPRKFLLDGQRCKHCSRCKTTEQYKKEVKETTNNEYELISEYFNSKTPVTILHKKCGNIYKVRPFNFQQGKRCPKCAIIIRTQKQTKTHEEFEKEVKELTNGEYSVIGKYIKSQSKILLKHNKCGTEFKMIANNFLNGQRCPKCTAIIKIQKQTKTHDEFVKEIKELTNDEYTVLSEYTLARKKITFKHNICGNIFDATPNSFLNGHRCPNKKCAKSKGEYFINKYCIENNISFEREYRINDCKNPKTNRKLPFDFKLNIPNTEDCILIEYDGISHFQPKDWFGGKNGLQERQTLDNVKNEYCKLHAIPLIRIHYYDYEILTEIMDAIVEKYNLK